MTKDKQIGWRTAAQMTVTAGAAAAVVMATGAPVPVTLSADSTALVLCGTTCPTPDDFVVDSVGKQFIAPTHPNQDIQYFPVTTPQELWPITGLFRLLGLALGPQSLFGLDGPAWPDEPPWKLSGLFDRTGNRSLQDGVAGLEHAMTEHPDDHLVIFGVSQGAGVANVEKRKLAEQYPEGTEAPDIDFVLLGDPNHPNGGLASRFAGLYVPVLDLTFNGPAATDTQFDTVEITRQYDGFADLPLYPLNVVSLVNALLGIVYVHMYTLDVSLPADPTTSPAYQGTHGDTSYYFFENEDLPLFGPLRTLGVPEPVIDVVEPFFRVLVELGYDRTIKPWEPTPARLIPTPDPSKVAADLVDAIGEGIHNAFALFDPATSSGSPAPAAEAPRPVRSEVNTAEVDVETDAASDTLTTEPPVTKGDTTRRALSTADSAEAPAHTEAFERVTRVRGRNALATPVDTATDTSATPSTSEYKDAPERPTRRSVLHTPDRPAVRDTTTHRDDRDARTTATPSASRSHESDDSSPARRSLT